MSQHEPTDSQVKIVVLAWGWVMVGIYTRYCESDTEYARLEKSACIRVWGTNRGDQMAGLGYLSERGPQPETRLDPQLKMEYLRIPQELFVVNCNDDVWLPVLEQQHANLTSGQG